MTETTRRLAILLTLTVLVLAPLAAGAQQTSAPGEAVDVTVEATSELAAVFPATFSELLDLATESFSVDCPPVSGWETCAQTRARCRRSGDYGACMACHPECQGSGF